MTGAFSEADLSSINHRIGTLQTSARRTLPMFVIGILATLLAAAIALYYIITLSGDLKEARASLRDSEVALATARNHLAIASVSLNQAQTAASSTNAPRIAAAISDVSRSQREVTIASASIKQAASKLPATTTAEEQPVQMPVGWFAVVGSYTIDAAGLAKATEQQQRAQAAGFCSELWQTQISRNYAVVIGSRSDRKSAARNIERARKAGIAADAFAQPDRGWTKLPESSNC